MEVRDALADDLRRLSRNIPEALSEIRLPVYVLDQQGIIQWQNAASLALFGDRREQHFSVVVAPETRQSAHEQFVRKMVGGVRTTSYDSVFLAGDGRKFRAEVETVRIDEDAEAVGVFGIIELAKFEGDGAVPQVDLTPRQFQVLRLLSAGGSTDMIAQELHVSRETVRNHVRDLLRALGVHSRVGAVVRAHELGI